MHTRRDEIATLLRRRILTGLRTRALAPGVRLPSTRDLAAQLGSDPRVVLAAYRELAREGMVELRPRSGIYLAPAAAMLAAATPSVSWLVEVLLDGIGHEVPAPALGAWLSRATGTRTMRALLLARTVDEREGVAQELCTDFGLRVDVLDDAALDAALGDDGSLVGRLRGMDVAVADPTLAALVRPAAERAGVPLVSATVGPDLLGDEWRGAGAGPGWVVHVDPALEAVVRRRFADDPAASARLRFVQVHRDDVGNIPATAAVYVTRAARARLDGRRVPGRHVAPARVLAPAAARTLLHIVVAGNLSTSTETA